MAYLEGIDVEVGHKRALELITSAVEAKENKVQEVIEKLVTMYKEGYGVERNYRAVIKWQRKLLGYYSENLEKLKKNPNRSLEALSYTYNKFYDALFDLIDRLTNDLKDFTEIKNYFLAMLSSTEQLEKDGGLLAIFYERIGDFYINRGDLEKSIEFYGNELVLRE